MILFGSSVCFGHHCRPVRARTAATIQSNGDDTTYTRDSARWAKKLFLP
jgi:hypothetical protein